MLIPELAESEDERIGKNLKDFLWRIANGEMNDRGTMPCAEKCQKWIAYLEKQKEPKPLPPFDEPTPEEKMEAFSCYIKDFQEKAEAAVGGWNNFDAMIRLYEQLKKL